MVLGIGGGQEISIIVRAVDQFSNTMNSLSDKLRANTAGFIALAAAGAGITAIGIASLKVAADFEQSRIAFTTMLGSAEKADKFLKELADFAKRTPFTLKGIETASRKLLAVGFVAEDVIPVMTNVGNIASGLGLGQEGLDRLILNLGQVQAQGKLTGRELRDFAIAGIPLLDELAKSLGKTPAEVQELVSAGEITTEMVLKAFKEMGSEGGRFANLMEKQMGSAAGQFSNLQDSIELLMRELGAALIPIVKKLLEIIIPIVTKIAEWTKENPQLTKVIVIATVAIGGLLLVVGTLGFLLPSLIAGFSALGVVITIATGPVGLIILGIAALVAIGYLLYKNWEVIVNFLKKYFAPEIEMFKLLITSLGIAFGYLWGNYIKPVWDKIKEFIEWIANVASGVIEGIINTIGKVVGAIASANVRQAERISAVRTSIVGGKQLGGVIQSTGNYMLHKGETILPSSSNVGEGINVYITGNIYGVDVDDISEALVYKLKQKIII